MPTPPASSPFTVLTGASRGMGLGIARGLIDAGHQLLTLQRTPNPELQARAQARGLAIEQWSVDLSEPLAVAERLRSHLSAHLSAQREALQDAALNLINNAALLAEPGPLRDADLADLSRATRASLEAPLLLTAAFLGATQGARGPRRVLNVSSGLGRFALAGTASYCAAKAGVDHLSRAVALEEGEVEGGARIVSLAPGVIDTDMQVQLRSGNAERFAHCSRFEQMKTSGALDSIDAAAAKVLAWLQREDFGRDPIGDVRQP